MSEIMLGYNIFKTTTEKTIENILEMELPNFSSIRPDIDDRLNHILHKALKRPRDQRYQSAEEMLTELESFIYGEGYGPTNEKLAAYVYGVLGMMASTPPSLASRRNSIRPRLGRSLFKEWPYNHRAFAKSKSKPRIWYWRLN